MTRFNSSIAREVFPCRWKQTRIISLKKCATPRQPKDFRPIAILCFLSKVLEKIAHDQLQEYITSKKLLDPMQTGFRKNHSTQTAVLKLTDDIRSGLDRKLVTLLLLFDFRKAFDTISPSKLLARLKSMEFSRAALGWINSYSSGRKQMVSTHLKEESNWLTTNLGVPQGSVLGPLLFCLYINNIRDTLDPCFVEYILYADDLQIYNQVPYEHLNEDIRIMQRAARAVSGWAVDASLTLNASKTKMIIFGSSRFIDDSYAGEPR
ncbi:reverse transcriptase family protein, partial [Escherichia coli]|uniref:RNA-directed DNA polymerase n=1 Tax=Escherichia coli TaxID=562 RepID=UPI002915C561